MTTIVFLEDSLPIPTVYDATEQIVNYHVHAVQARFPWELEARVVMFKQVDLKERLDGFWPYAEYKSILESLDKTHSFWSIRDDRVIFFLDQLKPLVKELKVLWVDLERSRTDYEKELQKRNRAVFDSFKGPKLHLKVDDLPAAIAFAQGEEVASKGKPKEESTE